MYPGWVVGDGFKGKVRLNAGSERMGEVWVNSRALLSDFLSFLV